MANILTRFTDIMQANMHSLLDKMEDPSTMIDQYLRNMESDLGKVKAETAAVMAEESRCNRKVAEAEAGIEKLNAYATKAVEAGNDNDAKAFLAKKAEETMKLKELMATRDVAVVNSEKIRALHDKLSGDIQELQKRKAEIKAKLAVAKAQQKTNTLNESIAGIGSNMSAIDALEEKANRIIDEADAMSKLNAPKSDPLDDLTRKYEKEAVVTSSVEDELAALKAKVQK